MARVAMAMSGGVDSSVGAALLKNEGHEVIGLHMKLYHGDGEGFRKKSCCSFDETLDARKACHKLGIPFYVIDYQKEFRESVIDYFVREYSKGKTPNPCTMCNKKIKNDLLLNKMEELECEYLATGHYARILYDKENGQKQLARARDLRKDQTYFLYGIKGIDIQRMIFPLGSKIKNNVRNIAKKLNLNVAKKPDSQEICFVPKDYKSFLKNELKKAPESGKFVSTSGHILGDHMGMPFYTIGQRRGIGISDTTPYYVVKINSSKNQIILGKEKDLYSKFIIVSEVNWISILPPDYPLRVTAKIRNMHNGSFATVFPKSFNQVRVEFEIPQRAITPGQAAVFYDNDIVLGGGIIDYTN